MFEIMLKSITCQALKRNGSYSSFVNKRPIVYLSYSYTRLTTSVILVFICYELRVNKCLV